MPHVLLGLQNIEHNFQHLQLSEHGAPVLTERVDEPEVPKNRLLQVEGYFTPTEYVKGC
jgi:hypothetical protein